MLKFSQGNAKLDASIAILSLPAGYTCPGAEKCMARANVKTGKIVDGPKQEFRCYAASQEIVYPNVRRSRWSNFNQLKGLDKAQMVKLITASLPRFASVIRLGGSGDFFSQDYFDAWLTVAKENPHRTIYAYTKSLMFWDARKNQIPSNFRLVASKGGKFDAMIETHGFRSAEVVYSVKEAKKKKLEIDHDDTHAIFGNESFALLIHGVQKAGTHAAQMKNKLNGLGSYGKGSKKS